MSGVSNYKDVSLLHRAHHELGREGVNVQDVVTKLPGHLQEKIAEYGAGHSSKSLIDSRARLAIKDIACEIYARESDNVQAKIHGVFYRYCRVSGTGDPDWGKNHVMDTDKVGQLLSSLELISMEREVRAWAVAGYNRIEPGKRILNFMNDPNQTSIDLDFLYLRTLPDIFDNMEMRNRLIELMLGSNRLESLPQSITRLSSLTKLYLVNNKNLRSLPESIGNLTSLTNLNLFSNQLQSLPESLGNLTSLNGLILVDNRLESLPESIGNLTRLEGLYLGDNRLQLLPESVGNLTGLTYLILSGNNLQSLPESIGNLSSLIKLDLSNNDLQSLPESIGNLSNLIKLDLSNNDLRSLPESIGNLSSLDELILRRNQLQSLPESIGNLTRLDSLILTGNILQSLPESIGNLTSLTTLNLAINQLQSVPESIGNLSNLTDLILTRNQLQSLPESVGSLVGLEELDIRFIDTLHSLPNSILNLPYACTVNIEGTGFSLQVMYRLRQATRQIDYEGPRFQFSIQESNHSQPQQEQTIDKSLTSLYAKAGMQHFTAFNTTYPDLYHSISEDSHKTNLLQSWLSRLSFMLSSEREGGVGLSRKVLSYLLLAEDDKKFRETFFAVIDGAHRTCGDRMALSVLHLGLQYRMTVFNKSDLRGYADFLIHGPWMLDRLEEISRVKVESLRFVDEIEVYLGYPVKLRERLKLQIDVEDMLYFSCSEITEADLDNAASFIENQLSESDAIANILVKREDWVKALKEQCKQEVNAIEEHKASRYEALMESSQGSIEAELQIQAEYEEAYRELTKTALNSK